MGKKYSERREEKRVNGGYASWQDYLKKDVKKEPAALNFLFSRHKAHSVFQQSTLNIFCPGVGDFPTMDSFVEVLLSHLSEKSQITLNITCVELIVGFDVKEAVERRVEELNKRSDNKKHKIKIALRYLVKDVHEELDEEMKEEDKYHIAYFEHPDLTPTTRLYRGDTSMLEFFPYLPQILQKNALVVTAAYLESERVMQQEVLRYSLESPVEYSGTVSLAVCNGNQPKNAAQSKAHLMKTMGRMLLAAFIMTPILPGMHCLVGSPTRLELVSSLAIGSATVFFGSKSGYSNTNRNLMIAGIVLMVAWLFLAKNVLSLFYSPASDSQRVLRP